jgi:hypothetical protein
MKTILEVLALAAAAFAVLPLALAQDDEPDPWLTVVQDESSVERKIQKYLEHHYGFESDVRMLDMERGDIVLDVEVPGEEAGEPVLSCVIDTEQSGHEEDDTVAERVILITSYYYVPDEKKTPAFRARILELNNRFSEEFWMPHRYYIDDDGDVVLESALNIPGPTYRVHAEMVYDLLVRTHTAWVKYLPELEKVLGE